MIVGFFNKYKKKLFIVVGFFFVANIFYNSIIPLIGNEDENIKLPSNIIEIRKSDLVFGKNDAESKLLIYADSACHGCVFVYNNNIYKIKELINKGVLQFIYRPTPMSKNSVLILNYVFGKNFSEEEKFKALSLIYANTKILHDENFKKEFKEIFRKNDLNVDDYDILVNVTKSDIMNNIGAAIKDGIKATPTIIINGKLINSADLNKILIKMEK